MRTARLAPAAGALLLLAACTGTGGGDEPRETTEQSAAPETPEVAEEEPAATGAECLQGEWIASNDSAEDITSLPGMENFSISVEGEARTTFTEDTVETAYPDGQSSTLTAEMEGKELVVTTTMRGTSSGSYTVEGDVVTITDIDASGLELEQATEIDGQKVDVPMPDLDELGASGALKGSMTFTCEGDELTLTPEGEGMDTLVQEYTRAS